MGLDQLVIVSRINSLFFLYTSSLLSQFAQFARTVGDSAVDQQRLMRDAIVGFADHISSTAHDLNATWPFFRIPLYELHAGNVGIQSGMEYIYCLYIVDSKDAVEYLDFVTANYEDSMEEAHMIYYGNLDRITPIGYTPNFTSTGPTGFVPDTMDRPIRSALWQMSPRKFWLHMVDTLFNSSCHLSQFFSNNLPTSFKAMSSYHRINWDTYTTPAFLAMGNAMFKLKNESLYTASFPYTRGTSLTDEEHDAMHSSRISTDISYPHNVISTPVYEIPNDSESKIVARLSGSFAWDYTLRHLLPDNVNGVMVELRNNCNQSSLYTLIGYDAFYLGENATKELTYQDMEVTRDLTLATHPNVTTTPGHCQYTIVSLLLFIFCSNFIT